MVLLVLAPADHVWTNVCARTRDAGRRSELRIPGIAAQTRMVSLARIRLVSRKSPRIFKRIICDDVSEFESHMPSHAVRSLWLIYGTSKNARHSTRLARLKRAQPRAGAWRSPELKIGSGSARGRGGSHAHNPARFDHLRCSIPAPDRRAC